MKSQLLDRLREIAHRISGVSVGPVGLSWDTAKKVEEKTLIKKFVLFLEDRRILHSPATGHSIASHLVVQGLDRSPCLSPHATKSILEIRAEIRKLVEVIPDKSASMRILKHLEATCRWALDCADRMSSDIVGRDPDYEDMQGYGSLEYGMTFLGLFRRKMGRDIKELAALHNIPIEGPLQTTIDMTTSIRGLRQQMFRDADKLVQPYMIRHSGFKKMGPGWFEKLCEELHEYTQYWEPTDWQRKAAEIFPDLWAVIRDKEATIDTVWLELLPRCRQAHREGNVEELQKIYGYAEWCHRQRGKPISHAVDVAFYEHLCDDSQMCNEMPDWVKHDIFADIAGLLELRMGKEAFVKLKERYSH